MIILTKKKTDDKLAYLYDNAKTLLEKNDLTPQEKDELEQIETSINDLNASNSVINNKLNNDLNNNLTGINFKEDNVFKNDDLFKARERVNELKKQKEEQKKQEQEDFEGGYILNKSNNTIEKDVIPKEKEKIDSLEDIQNLKKLKRKIL